MNLTEKMNILDQVTQMFDNYLNGTFDCVEEVLDALLSEDDQEFVANLQNLLECDESFVISHIEELLEEYA